MFRPPLLIILFTLTFSIISKAQYTSLLEYHGEFGSSLGATTYFGQIGGETHTYRANFGFYFRKKLADHIAIRLNYEYIPLGANDSLSNNPIVLQRGFQFFRPFHEIGFLIEYYLKSQKLRYNQLKFNPYIGIGMGYILNVPKDFNNFKTYKFAYEKWQDQYIPIATIPFNIGFQYPINSNLSLYSEFTYRYTTSDLIDNFGNADPISTKNGTFKPSKIGNDKFISIKVGISKTLVYRY